MNRLQILLITLLVPFVLVHSVSAAQEPEALLPLEPTPALEMHVGNQKPMIERIRTLKAFKRLGGGKKTPVDFSRQDLVMVYGTIGCADGKVRAELDAEGEVSFRVNVTNRCTHRTLILHHRSYRSAFAITKDATINVRVPVGQVPVAPRPGNHGEKLARTDATHLNLSNALLTDEDLAKLEDFHNLTHLYLTNTSLTDKDLENLSHMTKLIQLFIGQNEGITDAGLKHLSEVMRGNLQILVINGTGITPQGMKQLNRRGNQQKDQTGPQIFDDLVTPRVRE